MRQSLATLLSATVLMTAGAGSPAVARSCQDFHAEALHGNVPPPEASDGWPYRDACYIKWKDRRRFIGPRDVPERRSECAALPGYVTFEPDTGTNFHLCVFRPGNVESDMARAAPSPTPYTPPPPSVQQPTPPPPPHGQIVPPSATDGGVSGRFVRGPTPLGPRVSGDIRRNEYPVGVSRQRLAPSCIVVDASRAVSSTCDFRDGVTMYETRVRSAPEVGCPLDIPITYRDPESRRVLSETATRRGVVISTCRSGPVDVEIR